MTAVATQPSSVSLASTAKIVGGAIVGAYLVYINIFSKVQFNGTADSESFRRHPYWKGHQKRLNGKLIIDDHDPNLDGASKNKQNAREDNALLEGPSSKTTTTTTFLDSSKQYMFSLSPHHLVSVHHGNIFTNGVGFMDNVYSGPKRHAVASVLFKIPILRELFLKVGFVDAGKPTFVRMLRKGYSMVVLPGGIAEQVVSEYGREKVLLRKGFVKLAIEHKVSLVPVYGFGESYLYSTTNAFQGLRKFIAAKFYVGLTLHWGRWWCPFLPRSGVPLVSVIGRPIDTVALVAEAEKSGLIGSKAADGSTVTAVDVVFDRFVSELTRIFETYKAEAGYPNAKLELI